jgi:hypothetical protein
MGLPRLSEDKEDSNLKKYGRYPFFWDPLPRERTYKQPFAGEFPGCVAA